MTRVPALQWQQWGSADRMLRGRVPDSLLVQLLNAADMDRCAQQLATTAAALPGWHSATLIWSLNDEPRSPVHWHPVRQWPERALAQLGKLLVDPTDGRRRQRLSRGHWLFPLCGFPVPDGRPWAALAVEAERVSTLSGTPARQLLAAARHVLPLQLERQLLRQRVARQRAAETLQLALYEIADLAASGLDMPTLLKRIHAVVGRLMYAENFFIAVHDAARQVMRFLYFVDTHDPGVPAPETEIPLTQLEHSLSLAVVRLGRPLLGPSALLSRELGLPERLELGPNAEDWLGVPMMAGGEVRGVVVVQSYDPAQRFSERDRHLLGYVAQHLQPVLERRQAQEQLELKVAQRTQELREQVAERARGERLQRALFRIAELSSSDDSLSEFFRAVHGIVGELLVARNFFIGLLSADGESLDFPYAVDESGDTFASRKLRHGLTEYVLRTGQPLLAMPEDTAALIASGEVARIGTMSACWLGVPLRQGDRATGVLVVQSYTPGLVYTRADQDLLTFVSFHIGNALARKQDQEALIAANAELSEALNRLKQTQKQLVESEKMASLGGLVAGVAHEINTPLGVGLTAASHLSEEALRLRTRLAAGDLRRSELDRFGLNVHEASDLIERNLKRADQLVRSFKQVAVDQSVDEPREVELCGAVADILKMLAPALKRTPHEVTLTCSAPVSVRMPASALYPIVSNLVLNALQHAFADGTVGHVRLVIGIDPVAQRVELRCSDDGRGMDDAERMRVFEPFFTTRRGQGGTGLGLHIVYNLVTQLLHGSVLVESAPGAGSTFVLRWPMLAGG